MNYNMKLNKFPLPAKSKNINEINDLGAFGVDLRRFY